MSVRVIPTLDEAAQVELAARLDFERRFLNYTGRELPACESEKWWPLAQPSSN